ncbi:hypothetical protein MC885_006360 [Smutsia gigantea]|nr:hypothetical protein MC885_006360 [Smutsia gigantea]
MTTAVFQLLKSRWRNPRFLEQCSCCPLTFMGSLSGPSLGAASEQGPGGLAAGGWRLAATTKWCSLPLSSTALAISGCEGRCCPVLLDGGRLLEEQLPEMMTELLASARDKMLCPSESMLTRSLLLEVIELHANSWNPLTPPITQYYNRTIQKLTA